MLFISICAFLLVIMLGTGVRMLCLEKWWILVLFNLYTLVVGLFFLIVGLLLSLLVLRVSTEGNISFEHASGYQIPNNIFIDPMIPFQANTVIQQLAFDSLCENTLEETSVRYKTEIFEEAQRVKTLFETIYTEAETRICSEECPCKYSYYKNRNDKTVDELTGHNSIVECEDSIRSLF